MSLDINLLAAKIESLKNVVSSRRNMEKQWSEVIENRFPYLAYGIKTNTSYKKFI
jgi:hypothetical protein